MQLLRRASETAAFDDAGEEFEAAQPVHRLIVSGDRIVMSIISQLF
jgi:hypothetical protein